MMTPAERKQIVEKLKEENDDYYQTMRHTKDI